MDRVINNAKHRDEMCCEDALKVVEVFIYLLFICGAFAGSSGRRPNNVDLTCKGSVLFCLTFDTVKLLIMLECLILLGIKCVNLKCNFI